MHMFHTVNTCEMDDTLFGIKNVKFVMLYKSKHKILEYIVFIKRIGHNSDQINNRIYNEFI